MWFLGTLYSAFLGRIWASYPGGFQLCSCSGSASEEFGIESFPSASGGYSFADKVRATGSWASRICSFL